MKCGLGRCMPGAAGRRSGRLVSLAVSTAILTNGLPASAQAPNRPELGRFTLGADVSALAPPRRVGDGDGAPGSGGRGGALPPYQENGQRGDEASILKNHGWNLFRLRVFVSPVRSAPDNSLENTIPLAKKVKGMGAIFLLDLHFSDTWADPQHQDIPVAWRELDIDGLEKAWEKHAYDTVKALRDAGAMPDWVQIGNEITRGAAWPVGQLQIPGSNRYLPPQPYEEAKQWSTLTRLLKAGVLGVKMAAGTSPVRIAIHIDQGGHWEITKWFFDHIKAARVPYDIIAQSFYPPWGHGTLEGLQQNMRECARRYGKDFAVVETGYGRSRIQNNQFMLWPETPEGRVQFLVDLVNTVRRSPRGISVMYWAPERDIWNADGTPGPAVFTLDQLTTLDRGPASHAPAGVHP